MKVGCRLYFSKLMRLWPYVALVSGTSPEDSLESQLMHGVEGGKAAGAHFLCSLDPGFSTSRTMWDMPAL